MARITRKELKTDKFALEIEHTVTFFEEHRKAIVRYGAIVAAVVLVGFAVYFWRSQQHAAREEALTQAIMVQEAPAGGQSANYPISFPDQAAKDKEAIRQFSDIAAKYSGTTEGYVAEYYLGAIMADQGKTADAEKRYKAVADKAGKDYASLANLSLAQIYFADGRASQGEQLLRSLIAHPTMFVSKDQATLALASHLVRTNPAEARKLIDPLRTSRSSAVSQVAIQIASDLQAK